jgi:hypothetical protein
MAIFETEQGANLDRDEFRILLSGCVTSILYPLPSSKLPLDEVDQNWQHERTSLATTRTVISITY